MAHKTDAALAAQVVAYMREGSHTVTAASHKFSLSIPTICQEGLAEEEWAAIKRANVLNRPVRQAGDKARELVGQRFGSLVVLDVTVQPRTPSGSHGATTRVLVHCQCDCGGTSTPQPNTLLDGSVAACWGCSHALKDRTGERHRTFTVVERLQRTTPRGGRPAHITWWIRCDCGYEMKTTERGLPTVRCRGCESRKKRTARQPLGTILDGIKANARNRNIAWHLTDEQVLLLIKQPCHYCGGWTEHKGERAGLYQVNGIDRSDSEGCYEMTNVVPSCGSCNFAKRSETPEQFAEQTRRRASVAAGSSVRDERGPAFDLFGEG